LNGWNNGNNRSSHNHYLEWNTWCRNPSVNQDACQAKRKSMLW
jgi:predicted alpha/beta hydrolase